MLFQCWIRQTQAIKIDGVCTKWPATSHSSYNSSSESSFLSLFTWSNLHHSNCLRLYSSAFSSNVGKILSIPSWCRLLLRSSYSPCSLQIFPLDFPLLLRFQFLPCSFQIFLLEWWELLQSSPSLSPSRYSILRSYRDRFLIIVHLQHRLLLRCSSHHAF